jgi:hypothetical protein
MTRDICLLLVTLLGSAVTGGVFPGMGECGAEEKAVRSNTASHVPAPAWGKVQICSPMT